MPWKYRPKTLRQMAIDFTAYRGAFYHRNFGFDVVGYGCTSGATLIGEEKVDKLIRDIHPEVATTNPITATKAALSALGLKRIALLTPYPVGRDYKDAGQFASCRLCDHCRRNFWAIRRFSRWAALPLIAYLTRSSRSGLTVTVMGYSCPAQVYEH